MKIFQIQVAVEGSGTWTTYGSEEMILGAYEEIKQAKSALDGTGPKVVEIHGYSNTADKAEQRLLIDVDSIKAVDVTDMYSR